MAAVRESLGVGELQMNGDEQRGRAEEEDLCGDESQGNGGG